MANLNAGYIRGERILVTLPVDSSSEDIVLGDFISLATAGYVKQAAAGDEPYGVACESVANPASDGGALVTVDISQNSVYAVAPDEGTVTVGLLFKTIDVGGAQSANIDAGTDDSLYVVGVDTTRNLVHVQIRPTPASVD